MMVYIIGGGFLGLILGTFGYLLIFSSDNLNVFQKWGLSLLLWSTLSLICGLGVKGEVENFNNGYCKKCGTKYEAITRKNSSTYYECPNCFYGTWY